MMMSAVNVNELQKQAFLKFEFGLTKQNQLEILNFITPLYDGKNKMIVLGSNSSSTSSFSRDIIPVTRY